MDRYRIEGMKCGGCLRTIRSAVAAVAPGAVVEADVAAGELRVAGAPDAGAIVAAVSSAGFGIAPAVPAGAPPR